MAKERNGGGDDSAPIDSRVARRRQDPIGRRLRKIYTDVVEESIPDEFLAILEMAEAKQAADPVGGVGGGDPADSAPDAPLSQPER